MPYLQNQKLKIAIFEAHEWEKPYLKAKLKGCDVVFFRGILSESNADKTKDFDIISVFVYSRINKEIL